MRDFSCDTRPKQPLLRHTDERTSRSKARDCADCARVARNGAIVARSRCCNLLSHVCGSSSHLGFSFFLSLSGSRRLIELRLFPFFPCFNASQSDSVYLRLVFGSQSPQGFVFASPAPSSTLPPQLFFFQLIFFPLPVIAGWYSK